MWSNTNQRREPTPVRSWNYEHGGGASITTIVDTIKVVVAVGGMATVIVKVTMVTLKIEVNPLLDVE